MKLQEYITDIAAGPFGSNLKVSCFVEKGFPIIDGANLKGYKVTDNITKFVTEEKARSLHRSIAKRGDIVVTISGNVGQISYIPDDSEYEEYLVSQRQFRASFDRDKVNVAYLVYYFHTREGQYKILSFANQVGVPALAQPLKNFRNIEIDLPGKKEQDFIAAYIDNIEDKIAVNRRICENLEAQAQALFKHWFIDFAPFLDKPSGKAERKNGKFVESELGMIPEGWRVGTLEELCSMVGSGGTPKSSNKEYYLGTIPWFGTGEFNDSFLFDSIKHITEEAVNNSSARFYPIHTVLIAMYGATVGKLSILSVEATFNQAALGMVAKETIGYPFVYLTLLRNRKQLVNLACGAAQQNLNAGNIKTYVSIIPPKHVMNDFNNVIMPIFDLIEKQNAESSRLSTLRDTLLPKLMSGQIKVNEMEKSL